MPAITPESPIILTAFISLSIADVTRSLSWTFSTHRSWAFIIATEFFDVIPIKTTVQEQVLATINLHSLGMCSRYSPVYLPTTRKIGARHATESCNPKSQLAMAMSSREPQTSWTDFIPFARRSTSVLIRVTAVTSPDSKTRVCKAC